MVIHFVVGDAAALMAKLGTRQNASVYKGEWVYRTRSEAFKDKARLQLHCKSFSLKQLYNIIVLNKVRAGNPGQLLTLDTRHISAMDKSFGLKI